MKKQEKEEKERQKKEQQKAIEEEIILNEKEQLRIELEIMEAGNVESEALESENDKSHVNRNEPGIEQQVAEREQNRHDALADCV